jgi:hypothetical protein
MSSDRYLLFLFWGGLLVLLASLLALAFCLRLAGLIQGSLYPESQTDIRACQPRFSDKCM